MSVILKVKSSQIKAIEFREKDDALRVYFQNGRIYDYAPFTKDRFDEFFNADSIGSYFHKNIKSDKTLITKRLK